MREILFRGKRIDNGEWEEGFVFDDGLIDSEKMFIGSIVIENNEITGRCFCEVDPKTVGQYTGLKCKNGRIFEGDIIRFDDGKGVINFNIGCFCVKLFDADKYCLRNPAIDVVLNEYPAIEVIGNIHDNPELMEVR